MAVHADRTAIDAAILALFPSGIQNAISAEDARNVVRDVLDTIVQGGAGSIPFVEDGILRGSSMVEDANGIVSTKSLTLPDASLQVGNFLIENGGQNVVITETSSDERFNVIASALGTDSATSLPPRWYHYGDSQVIASPSDTSETTPSGTSYQFVVEAALDNLSSAIRINSVGAVTDANFIIRLGGHSNADALFDYKRATGGTGFDLTPGMNDITLPVPFFARTGINFYVTIEADNAFQLRGQTLMNVGGEPSQLVPYFQLTGRPATERELSNAIQAMDEGTEIAAKIESINFTGAGVTATNGAGEITVNIPGGGGGTTGVNVQDEGTPLTGIAETLNFTGSGVTVTGTGATKTVEIPGLVAGNFLGGVATFSTQTGNFEITSISNVLYHTGTNITGLTISDSTIADDTVFAIHNELSSAITVTLTGSGISFQGLGSGTTYDIPAGQIVLFYVRFGGIYPILNFNAASGATGDDHPVTLTRDTPSLTELADLANASLDDNSALWVVANDQVQSTEDNVDPTVIIRALKTGLLDADNTSIPTTATAKSGVRLQAGTIVRVFSSTDLRVVSTPTIREQAQRYPDLPVADAFGPLTLVGQQVLYNIYRNRTAVFDLNLGQTFEVRLPSLQNALDLGWVNRSDVFCFRNDGTNGTVRVRTFQVGTQFSDTTTQIDIAPGEILCITPAPSGAVWSILEFGQASTISLDPLTMSDWYRDGVDATAVDNNVRMHHRQDIVSGDIRDHILSVNASSQPVSIRFERIDLQDDHAWAQFWSTFGSGVPPISGANVEVIEAEIAAALSYISTNINNGYDFEFDDPTVLFPITSITHTTGTTLRVNFATPLPAHIAVNDVMTISGNSFAANNGDWAITSIAGDRLAFDITIPGASASNNTGASGTLSRTIYADAVLVNHNLRQVNINLYHDSARLSPVGTVLEDWFSTEIPGPGTSILSIGYSNDIEITDSFLAIQDKAGNFYSELGGPRRQIHLLYNGDPNNGGATEPEYSLTREMPENFPVIHIQTQAAAEFYFNTESVNIPVGESRLYRVYSDPDNDANDVTLRVGHNSASTFFEFFDNGIPLFSLQPGAHVDIEGYNDGTLNGWRIASPFQKVIPSTNLYPSPVTAFAGLIPTSLIDVIALQNEDPSFVFFTTSGNRMNLKTDLEYRIQAKIDVLFNGAEGTGLLFVPVTLMPVLRRGVDPAADLPQHADTSPLLFSRNGQTGSSAPKYVDTLDIDFTWQAQGGDDISFEARFGTFPAGYSVSDLQFQNFRWSVTVQGNLD